MRDTSHSAVAPWAKWTALGGQLTVAAAAYSLFVFAEPLTDDFCTALSDLDLPAFLRERYLNWSGRWFGLGVERFILSKVDFIRFYPVLPSAVSLCLVASFYVFIRSFFRHRLPPRLVLVLTATFFVLFWNLHPSLGQTFYWFTGSVEYELTFALSLVLIATVISAPDGSEGGGLRFTRAVSAFLLAFLAVGTHELFGLMLFVVLVVGTIAAHYLRHANRGLWTLAAASALVSLAFVLAAPGYAVRRASFPGSYNLALALRLALPQALSAGVDWICSGKLLTATILFVIHPRIRSVHPEWVSRMTVRWKHLMLATWLAMLAVGVFVPVFATGREMAGRVLGGVYLVFLLGWFVLVFAFTRESAFLAILSNIDDRHLRVLGSWTLLLFSISIAATGNTRTAIFDLVHRAPPWHKALHHRYDLIRTAHREGIPELSVPEPPPRPALFYQGSTDITPDTADWKNLCVARFFGIRSLRTVSEGISSDTVDRP